MLLRTVWFLSYSIWGTLGDASCVDAPSRCPETPYRSLDGSCNNLKHPSWGMANNRYGRLLPAKYADGISSLAVAKSGRPLPGPRKLSVSLYPERNVTDRSLTLNTMQFGQFISHDLSLTFLSASQSICCSPAGQMLDVSVLPHGCQPFAVPEDDPDYSKTNIRCMSFLRTTTDSDRGCKIFSSQPVEQLTKITSYLDLSLIYGNDKEANDRIRKFQRGLLQTEKRRGQYWPISSNNSRGDCPLATKGDVCYFSGTDERFNQNPQLLTLEVLFYREHNRIALELSEMNPHWEDEKLFQEARKIAIASYQNIIFYEWLPLLFKKEVLVKENIHHGRSYVDDYDDEVNPAVSNEFSNAAYRHYHSAVAGQLNMMTEDRRIEKSLRMSDCYLKSGCLETNGNTFDDMVRGLNTQHQMAMDRYHDKEISLYLFRGSNHLGRDLIAIDIQRSRDHGLASYNDMREYCGFKKAVIFREFEDTMSEEHINLLESLYEDPDDVDLYVGGGLETNSAGSLVGPVFECLMLKEFRRARITDRFWFERSTVFSGEQLEELRNASMSRIVCDNSKSIGSMQKNAFLVPGPGNVLVPCTDLPFVDLAVWKEN